METILGAELENKVPLAQFCPSQNLSALPLHFHFCWTQHNVGIRLDVSKKWNAELGKNPGKWENTKWEQKIEWVNPRGGGGGYFRNFWVRMCHWDPGTLNLYQS